jgi:hypothetical protein
MPALGGVVVGPPPVTPEVEYTRASSRVNTCGKYGSTVARVFKDEAKIA